MNRCAGDCAHIDRANGNRFGCTNKQYTALVIVCANDNSLLMIKTLGSKSEKSNIVANLEDMFGSACCAP